MKKLATIVLFFFTGHTNIFAYEIFYKRHPLERDQVTYHQVFGSAGYYFTDGFVYQWYAAKKAEENTHLNCHMLGGVIVSMSCQNISGGATFQVIECQGTCSVLNEDWEDRGIFSH